MLKLRRFAAAVALALTLAGGLVTPAAALELPEAPSLWARVFESWERFFPSSAKLPSVRGGGKRNFRSLFLGTAGPNVQCTEANLTCGGGGTSDLGLGIDPNGHS